MPKMKKALPASVGTDMSHPTFKAIGSPEVRCIEECAELIQAVCKLMRFGHRFGEFDNVAQALKEIGDVNESIKNLLDTFKESA